MGPPRLFNHMSNILESLEEFEASSRFTDLRIVCMDGVILSYKLLLGACSEMLKNCLDVEYEGEDACIILPTLNTWEIKVFQSALLCHNESPTNKELDAVLKVFATIGGNVGPYVDVDLHTPDPELTLAPGLNLGKPGSKLNLTPSGVELNLGSGGTDIDISDLSSICLLSVDPKSEAEQDLEKEERITLIIPSSLDVFPVSKRTAKILDDVEELKLTSVDENLYNRTEIDIEDLNPAPSPKLKRKYSCPFCERGFVNLAPFEKHLAIHQGSEGENPLLEKDLEPKPKLVTSSDFICNICNKKLTSSSSLKTHLDLHNGELNVECEICNKRFVNKSTLKNHMKSHDEDTNTPRFLCNICEKIFSHPSNLKRHIKHVHMDDESSRNHDCELCGKKFKDNGTLKTHMANHQDIRKFPCTMCSKSFVKRSQLKTHFRIHTGDKPFTCNFCVKSFKTAAHLKSHKLNRHVGIKLNKSHLCQECGQGFVKEYDLRVHIRRHRNEKPFKCLTCEKSFHGERHFMEHSRTHTGEKPYQCENCKRCFATTSGLRQHFKSYANCRLQATEGAYSKFPQKRTEWQRLGGIHISEFIMSEESGLHSIEEFTVEELKDTEETVVYITSDLGLVGEGMIEQDLDGQVNIQTLPLEIDTEGGEVLNLVEMTENL